MASLTAADGCPEAGPILGRAVTSDATKAAPQSGFAGAETPAHWQPPRCAPRGDRLGAGVEALAGVGPTLRRKLARLGLETVEDVLLRRPRRYEQPLPERTIATLFGEEEAVLDVSVRRASGRRRGRLHILTATVEDETGDIRATWFNQPWLESKLTAGTRVRIRGRRNRYGFAVDSYDIGDAADTADFAPVYASTEDLAQRQLRSVASAALAFVHDLGDPVPASTAAGEGLPLRTDAIVAMHHPDSLAAAELARQRLAFDELLTLQLALVRRSAEREALVAEALPDPGELLDGYRDSAPVHADGRPGAGDHGDRRGSGEDDAHAASAPGRRRLGEDRWSPSTRCCGRSRRDARVR